MTHIERPQNPGSLRNFAAGQGLDTESGEAVRQYSEVLDIYRHAVAKLRGKNTDDLHFLPDAAQQPLPPAIPDVETLST